MTASQPSLEILLRHQEWVRALARSLVADPSRADDVAQQTMLEAIQRPPRELSRPKAWLAKVAGNIARGFARQEGRRTRREQVVARDDVSHADPADAAQRAAMHKRVVDALFELPEPYHTVVLLRYFEDLDAREVAAQLDRPLATVRTQLQRGLERMRAQLDQQFGNRDVWCTALLPLIASNQAVIAVPVLGTAGALVMLKWMISVVAVSAALFFSVQFAFPWDDPSTQPSAASPPTEVAATMAQPKPSLAPARVVADTTAALDTPNVAESDILRGRLVELSGRPVIGLTVSYYASHWPRLVGSTLSFDGSSIDVTQPGLREELATELGLRGFAATFAPHAEVVVALLRGAVVPAPRTTTDGFGRFELAGADDAGGLRFEGSDLTVYGEGRVADNDERVFVVGPAVAVAGQVVAADGRPLADVNVCIGFQLSNLPGIAQTLQSDEDFQTRQTVTDSEGRFELGVVPRHGQVQVAASKHGYQSASTLTTAIVGPVHWVLREQPVAERKYLAGFVQQADGSPAAFAKLVFGQDQGKAGSDGRFEMDLSYFRETTDLIAYLPQQQPAILEGLGARIKQDPSAGRDLALRLGGPALSISGRIMDREGQPCVGMSVVLSDGVPYGSATMSVESAVGGRSSVGERTDNDGRFVLTGLSDRPYNIRALDRSTLLVLESGPVMAGTKDLQLTPPPDAFFERVEGVVVDRFGVAVVGASVTITATVSRGSNGRQFIGRPGRVVTDDGGHFVLEHCPRRHVQVSIGGDGVITHELAVPLHGAAMRVVVARKLRFRIRSCADQATSFTLRNASDEQVSSTAQAVQVHRRSHTHRIEVQASPVYEVDDSATMIVLLSGERELRRVPLNLQHNVLNELDL